MCDEHLTLVVLKENKTHLRNMYHTFHSIDSFSLQSKSDIYITYRNSATFSLQSKSNLLVLAFDENISMVRERQL